MNSQSPAIRLLAIPMILMLVACGGGGGGGSSLVPDNGVTPVPGGSGGGTDTGTDTDTDTGTDTDTDTDTDTGDEAPTARDITVSVSGTSGTVVVQVGDTELSFTGDGSQTLSDVSYDQDVAARILSAPAGVVCLFTPAQQDAINVDREAVIECGGPSVTGFVRDSATGDPIASAAVAVSLLNEQGTGVELALDLTTDAEGRFSIENITTDRKVVVAITAEGYASNASVMEVSSLRPILERDIYISKYSGIDVESPDSEMNFSLNGVRVLNIPANGLQKISNPSAAVAGVVTAEITVLDASGDPTIIPGRFRDSAQNYLESFGGISLKLVDEDGDQLELKTGVEASIAIPAAKGQLTRIIAAAAAEAESESFINFQLLEVDADLGLWFARQTTRPSFEGITRTFEGTITALNADSNTFMVAANYRSNQVSGCMIDLQGNRVAGVQVITQGENYIGMTYTTTNENGNFLATAKEGENLLIYGLTNTRSRTAKESTNSADADTPPAERLTKLMDDCILIDDQTTVITLTWGENPSDLDSQLFGPTETEGERFHIYYVTREATVNGVTMFLDVDDVTSFGPEVTTIPKFPLPGIYEFFVDLFAGTGTIRNSPAKVEVNAQGNRFVFSPGSGTVDKCWHVFDIEVDDQLKGTVIKKDDWVDETVCDTGLQQPAAQ
jgi:hypothetical protein